MLYNLTATEAKDKLASKEITAQEIALSILERINDTDDSINAYLEVTADSALAAARRADEDKNELLSGLSVAVKDNVCTLGVKTTCASRMLIDYIPPYEATATRKLWEQGAGLLGKTNLDEFAMGSSTETSYFGTTCNPHDVSRVPGGSSGGSAAAVAAGSAMWALGSDTGGSVRAPAAFCGVIGLKPSYGRVSRKGLIAFASSLDQIGPIARSVPDAALLLTALCGHDPDDASSNANSSDDFISKLTPEVKGLRVGVIKEHMGQGVDPEIKECVLKAARVFSDLGCEVTECSLPHSQYAVAAYYLIAPAEASSNLARFDGVRYGMRAAGDDINDIYMKTRGEGFGREVQRRIMLGTYALSSGYYDDYYIKGQQLRTLIKKDFEQAFSQFDVLIGPTTPAPAFGIGECCDDPLKLYAMDVLTIPANLAGIPAITLPCGRVNGLPVGLQLQTAAFSEHTLLQTAHAYEQAVNMDIRPVDPKEVAS